MRVGLAERYLVEIIVKGFIWLYFIKGVSSHSNDFVDTFESNQINGKKLAVLELSDLDDILNDQDANLNQKLGIYKSIQNLLQMVIK